MIRNDTFSSVLNLKVSGADSRIYRPKLAQLSLQRFKLLAEQLVRLLGFGEASQEAHFLVLKRE